MEIVYFYADMEKAGDAPTAYREKNLGVVENFVQTTSNCIYLLSLCRDVKGGNFFFNE